MRKITKFVTDDNKEFISEDEARKHEQKMKNQKELEPYKLSDAPKWLTFLNDSKYSTSMQADEGYEWYCIPESEKYSEVYSLLRKYYGHNLPIPAVPSEKERYPFIFGYNQTRHQAISLKGIESDFSRQFEEYETFMKYFEKYVSKATNTLQEDLPVPMLLVHEDDTYKAYNVAVEDIKLLDPLDDYLAGAGKTPLEAVVDLQIKIKKEE